MRGGKVRKLLVIAALGAVIAAVVKALRGDDAPQFSTHPSVTGGPAPTPAPSPAPTPVVDAPEPEPDPEPAPAVTAGSWAEPVDGVCPDGYPVKAKLRSGIYHQPGTATYDRTRPDRCYATAEAAEADGLRPPKR